MNEDIEFIDDDQPVIQEQPKSKRIPAEYVAVKFSSLGKLTAPPMLHVRDYTAKDALELSLASTTLNAFLRQLVDVLNNLVFEGFDCRYLHESELEEIMLSITGNFLTPTITNYPFPYTQDEFDTLDDERKTRIKKGLETLTIDVHIADIKTKPIKPEFKEPISITNKQGLTVQFRLPLLNDYFVAEDYIEEKYAEEAQTWSYMDKIFAIEDDELRDEKLVGIDREVIKSYNEYLHNRGLEYIVAKQAQLVTKFGSKNLDTLKEQMDHYAKIGMGFWKEYNSYSDDYLDFGVDHNIEMISPITGEKVIRRCQFRPMDYISADDVPESGKYTILFG